MWRFFSDGLVWSLIRSHNNENVGLNETNATTSAIYISDAFIECSQNIPKSTFLRMFTSACFTSVSRHGSNSTSAGVKNCDLYQYFLLELFGNIFGHLSPVEQGLNAKRCGRENRFSFRYSHPGHYHFIQQHSEAINQWKFSISTFIIADLILIVAPIIKIGICLFQEKLHVILSTI